MYRLLENPFIYNLSQKILAPGYRGELEAAVNKALQGYEKTSVLELGAGTGRFSPRHFTNLVVTDINGEYLKSGGLKQFVRCSATEVHLQFAAASFDLIFSVGLYHHLSDEQFHDSIRSSIKVLKPKGLFMVIDNIWPTNRFNFPAYLIRRLDRGNWVRTTDAQLAILRRQFSQLEVRTGAYSYFNLEFNVFACRL